MWRIGYPFTNITKMEEIPNLRHSGYQSSFKFPNFLLKLGVLHTLLDSNRFRVLELR
jgi:hypothetical protein